MRDRRYVAVHRGGPLSKQDHYLLALWAADCAEHVLSLYSQYCPDDERPQRAIDIARAWARGEVSVGDARAASVAAHAAAREAQDQSAVYVARACGHAVATAHMADHAPGAAMYAIKAIQVSGGDAQQEHCWQKQQLPDSIRELVLSTFATKFKKLGV